MPLMTPPLSSKSITPGGHITTPFPNFSRPGSSLSKDFNFYNPKCEKKAKDRISFDESIHDYLANRPVATSKGSTGRPSTCLLSISWPTAEFGFATNLSEMHKSSYYVDIGALLEHHNLLPQLAHMNALLDGNASAVQVTGMVERTVEEGYVEIIQSSCRQLCSLLQVLANPSKSTITYIIDHTSYIKEIACGILRQLYHKAAGLWETIFDRLRLWVSGRRNKPSFARQKEAVTVSLARLCNTVETYGHVRQEGSNEQPFAIWKMASHPHWLISELEFLGRGIDMKKFNAARQKSMMDMAVLSVSTIDADGTPVPQCVAESNFLDIFTAKHHPKSSSQNHGLQNRSPQSSSQTPSTGIPIDVPGTFELPTDPGLFDFSFNDGSPDASHELKVQETTAQIQATILELQADLLKLRNVRDQKEQELQHEEQRVRDMEEQIYNQQSLLGPAQPPAHMDVENIFDEMPVCAVAEAQDSGSPGDVTLVEPDLNLSPYQFLAESSSKRPISGSSDLAPDHERPYPDDFPMEDFIPDQIASSDAPTSIADKKRKRFSFLPAAKKARTSEQTLPYDPLIESSPFMNRAQASRPIESTEIQTTSSTHLTNADKSTKTTRPISWPRNRLFRRSAGVSVRKITEVFEKLRLQHDKALPAAM
ncbi:MAG: hypothetical protein Q9169_006413 [Polycauliona sp. 2 TL-2023]